MNNEGDFSPQSSLPSRMQPSDANSNLTGPTSNPTREGSGIGEREHSTESQMVRRRPAPLEDFAQTNSTKKSGMSASRFFQAMGIKAKDDVHSTADTASNVDWNEKGNNKVAMNNTLRSQRSTLSGTASEIFDMKGTKNTRFASEVATVVTEPPRAQSFWNRGGLPQGRFAMVLTANTLRQMQFGAQEKAKTAITCTIGCLVAWFVLSSALLILFGVQYDSDAVAEDRARYADITAERAAAYAATVLAAGLAARDALDYAIQSKLYFEPLDYEAVRATLEPVFGGFALLRSVDLAFSDRDAFITMRRMVNDHASVGSFMSMDSAVINELDRASALAMQSSAEDCTLLGERGCLAAAPAQTQRWYGFASHLWAGEEADGLRPANPQVFSWDDRPGFVPRDPSRGLATSPTVEWLPAYSLLFRIPFPGSRGMLSVFGRSVIELSDLRVVDSLQDENLGERGAIYICDRGGRLLAAVEAGTQVSPTPKSGVFRFQYIHELEAVWASELRDFDGTARNIEVDKFYVVVQPLSGRGLSNFSAVIAAEREPFIDKKLGSTIVAARVVVILPYPVVMLVSGLYLAHWDRKRKRNARRGTVLKEGIETLQDTGESLDDLPEVSETMNALRKRTLAKTMMAQREAENSMLKFLEESAKPGEEHGEVLALVEYHKPA